MYNFNSTKSIYRKIFIMLVIFGVLGSGLYVFDDNQNFLYGFQLYYAKMYAAAFSYTLDNDISAGKNLLASVVGAPDRDAALENNMSDYAAYAKSVPVLLYHGVVDKSDGANILPEDFKNQMFVLKKAGWQTITLDDFYAFMRGEKQVPDKSFLLTFDDGRKDSYYPVDPILKALDYNAATFVITKYSLEDKSGNFYLSKKELKQMAKSGRWEIEAHTQEGHDIYKISQNGQRGHYYTNKLWLDDKNRFETTEEFTDRIGSDFASAKNDVERGLGVKVTSFAFPFGDFGQDSVNFPEARPIILDSAKSIYSMAFYQVWPGKGLSFNYPSENQFLIKRIDVKPDWTADNLLKMLDAGREKDLPFADAFSDYGGWIKTWGELSFADDSMILSSRDSTTGGSAFLDGTHLWQNYVLRSKVDLVKGQTFSILARYADSKNYVSCSFSPTYIKIERTVDGLSRTLVKRKGNFEFIGKEREFGIAVYDDAVNCYVDDKIAVKLYGGLHENLGQGGIGFKTWDSEMNNSGIIVKEISVEEIK